MGYERGKEGTIERASRMNERWVCRSSSVIAVALEVVNGEEVEELGGSMVWTLLNEGGGTVLEDDWKTKTVRCYRRCVRMIIFN